MRVAKYELDCARFGFLFVVRHDWITNRTQLTLKLLHALSKKVDCAQSMILCARICSPFGRMMSRSANFSDVRQLVIVSNLQSIFKLRLSLPREALNGGHVCVLLFCRSVRNVTGHFRSWFVGKQARRYKQFLLRRLRGVFEVEDSRSRRFRVVAGTSQSFE